MRWMPINVFATYLLFLTVDLGFFSVLFVCLFLVCGANKVFYLKAISIG